MYLQDRNTIKTFNVGLLGLFSETTIKINEIANINSQYPINDKKIAQALLRFYNKLNN